jgi:DNA modification methylase
VNDYKDFLLEKLARDPETGFEAGELSPALYPFQAHVVRWALRRGRAAVFADCGLGKTPMQLEWATRVVEHTGGRVLILAPLAVGAQTGREAHKFGVDAVYARDLRNAGSSPIVVTNYERLERFVGEEWAGIVLDESSILKSYDGKTRRDLTDFAQSIPFRLACTATPAPNATDELANHAEFLGVLTGKEMLALFFTQDGNTTHAWRLKGHARRPFWRWLASWAIAARRPSDLGFDDASFVLPPLRVEQQTVASVSSGTEGLFPVEASTLSERRDARRRSLADRVAGAARLVNGSDEPWVVWCDLNAESEALTAAIPGAVEVRGSDSAEHKERALVDFSEGRVRVLVTKPSIAGFGMNWQHCARMVFVGLSDSYEQFYQAVRRCWRFGQTRPVVAHVVTSEAEGAVVRNIERKERMAEEMMDQLVHHMHEAAGGGGRSVMPYERDQRRGSGWTLHLGDSVEVASEIEDETVGLTVFSPPFPGMYAYTNSPHDMGNVRDQAEMIEQYRFLVPELLRVTMPGRSCAVHLCQGVAFKGVDGYTGIKDFRGDVIDVMEDCGWIYYGEVCIDKDPQVKAIRTKDRGLLFKTLATDSAHMHMALADYVLQFRKPGDNPEPIRAGISQKYKNEHGWISQEEWIEWAAPVWYRAGEGYPGGIRETDVLNVRSARESDDERHLAPLQLGVIERAVKLWSNPGDLVFSPFAGIGSEGVGALRIGRRFVGIELKRSYFETACRNLERAAGEMTLEVA